MLHWRQRTAVALLAEGVDRNILKALLTPRFHVALLAEGVDRNFTPTQDSPTTPVALLAEGVDRNRFFREKTTLRKNVALLAEGVDRNFLPGNVLATHKRSPSSRRAWIEISWASQWYEPTRSPSSRRAWIEMTNSTSPQGNTAVALLAEGVDRNLIGQGRGVRASVALLAEGVDRNLSIVNGGYTKGSRPPRGGRG